MPIILPEVVAIGVYNTQTAVRNKTVTQNRRTAMFEIEMPIEDGGVSYIDEDALPITPTHLICAKPGQIRHTKLPYKCYYIHMMLTEGELYDILFRLPSFIPVKETQAYRNIFTEMQKHFERGVKEDEILLQSLILALIHMLYRDAQNAVSDASGKIGMREITETLIPYIKQNLTADLSLGALAQHMHLSPTYLHNRFKAATGKTLREFVEEQRIKAAANLLISTDLTLTEIAYRCGFSSQSYFSMAFKRKMRQTPRDYVKEISKRYFS